jgi:hypothetical protein
MKGHHIPEPFLQPGRTGIGGGFGAARTPSGLRSRSPSAMTRMIRRPVG